MNKVSKIILQAGFLVGLIVFVLILARQASNSEAIQQIVSSYGYIGIFIISIISGFNLFVPIPAASFLPLILESGLSFWPTILLITLGMTIADIIAFFLARAGKYIVSQSLGDKLFERFHNLREKYYRYPLAMLFIFASVMPLPNEIILVPGALMGYTFKQILPVVLAGNFVFNILFASGIIGIFYN